MRIAIISDSHTKENLEFIYEYLKNKSSWKLDMILINGDILGQNEVREGYGYGFNKKVFDASLDKNKLLNELAQNPEELKKISAAYEQASQDEALKVELSVYIRKYVSQRYDYVFNMLEKFSRITKTYFNIGTYESPLHYNVLKELSFLLEVPETYIRSIALLSNHRETFKEFLAKIKDPKLKKLNYLGGSTVIIGDLMIAGIPGLNESSGSMDNTSEFQEKITKDLLNTIRRQLSYVNKLIILNQTQGKLRKDPFAFRPASIAVREFIEEMKGKLKTKIFIQSYHHFMTTHFYNASEFFFILNNSAVNNCLFNLIEIGTKISCYDVDPKKDILRKLRVYNYNLADYDNPKDRLALNYDDPEEVIKERKLGGSYYL